MIGFITCGNIKAMMFDYEYHITYEKIPKKKMKLDFKGLKKVDLV